MAARVNGSVPAAEKERHSRRNIFQTKGDIMSVTFFEGTPRNPPLPFSPAVRAGNFVFISGQVARGANGEIVSGGIEAQTRQVMANMEAALKLAGCTLDDVIKVTIWLDDARDFNGFNKTYAEYFPNNKPVSSTVQSALMIVGKLEVEAIAYKED